LSGWVERQLTTRVDKTGSLMLPIYLNNSKVFRDYTRILHSLLKYKSNSTITNHVCFGEKYAQL
jgi:hypothetical protein